MITSSDSGRSSNVSLISTILSFSLLTTSRKSSINVSRSIGLIDGPKPSNYINNTDEEESIIGLAKVKKTPDSILESPCLKKK